MQNADFQVNLNAGADERAIIQQQVCCMSVVGTLVLRVSIFYCIHLIHCRLKHYTPTDPSSGKMFTRRLK